MGLPVEELPEVTVDLEVEHRRGRIAAVAAVGSVVLTLAAVPIAATGQKINAPSGSDLKLLLGVGQSGDGQLGAMWARVASVLLLIVVAWFLHQAIGQRDPKHFRWLAFAGSVGFIIVAVCTALGFYEVREAARIFVDAGPRTGARATHLLDVQRDKGPLRVADIGQLVGSVLFGLWICLVSYESAKVGLMTRFLGYFGIGAGLTTVIGIPVAPALFLGWLGSLGCLAWGYWPGGRPRAWDEGRSISWDEEG